MVTYHLLVVEHLFAHTRRIDKRAKDTLTGAAPLFPELSPQGFLQQVWLPMLTENKNYKENYTSCHQVGIPPDPKTMTSTHL